VSDAAATLALGAAVSGPRADTLLQAAGRRRRRAFAVAVVVLVVAVVAGLVTGAHRLDLVAALAGIVGGERGLDTTVLLTLRLPRVVLGVLVGGGLGLAGATLQGLARNPLADPGLLGASSGAALGAALAIVGATTLVPVAAAERVDHPLLLVATPLGAFVFALLVLMATRALTRERAPQHLLLVGVGLNAVTAAALGFVVAFADDAQLRALTFWSLGSLGGATPAVDVVTALLLVPALLLCLRAARGLSLLLVGEKAAAQLGVDVPRLTRQAGLGAGLAVAAVVSVAGVVGFVGFLAPHIARRAVGADARDTLPAAFLVGAALVVLADVVARTVVAPAELPLGVVTAAVGAPVFLVLLQGRRP
jgi:iron complex transport system permease protein